MKKQIKAIESQLEKQVKAIEEHGKQLVKYHEFGKYKLSLDKPKSHQRRSLILLEIIAKL